MGSNWIVEDMGEDQEEAPDEDKKGSTGTEVSRTFCLLDSLKHRLLNNIGVCEELMIKMQNGEDITEDDELEMDKLELTITRFMTELKEVFQNKITTHTNTAECAEIQMRAEDLLLALKRKCKSRRAKFEGVQPKLNANTTSRLPKLNITTFDGNYLKWYAFWDSFKSTIGNRTDLSSVDKLSYLVDLLKGDALETIQNLEKTHANYKVAVDILTERFGKSDMIIDAHYDALYDMKPAQNNAKECRKVLNQIEGHLRVLKSLGEDIEHNMLRSTIKRKFPKEMKGNLWLRIKSKGYTATTLRETLEEIISANEEEIRQTGGEQTPRKDFTTDTLLSTVPSGNTQTSTQQPSDRKRSFRNSNQHRYTGKDDTPPAKRQWQGNSNPGKQSAPIRACIFCQGSHYNEDCPKFTSTEDRQALLRKEGRCFLCLKTSHYSSKCSAHQNRACAHCGKTGHNRCICKARKPKPNEVTTTSMVSQSQGDTILQMAIVAVSSEDNNHSMTARTLFDTGSQKSYVTTALANALHLKTIEESCLTVYTFGQLEPKTVPSRLVLVKIRTSSGENIVVLAYVVPNITGLIPAFPHIRDRIKQSHPHLQIADDSDNDSKADILIGNDQYHSIITGTCQQISEKLFLIQSKIGWILSGSTCDDRELDELLVLTFVQGGLSGLINRSFTVPDPPLQEDNIKDIWELETIGIKDSPKMLDQDEIIKFFNETTLFENNRYQVKWPWIEYPVDLPVNYGMAFGRLSGLVKRSDTSTLQLYDQVLQDQLSKGIIEIIQETKLPTTHAVHYLPHHCVVQSNKTTKLRVVYDASAKSKGHCSLNEYLYRGPLMLEDLVSLLLRFRTTPIGVTADIEKAFLQVGLQTDDRDVTRFLWLKDISQPVTEDNVVHLRFCRVPFGIISSPYLLAATIKHHLGRKQCNATNKISGSLYVDNLVTGVDSAKEGLSMYKTAVVAFNELSMNLRDWTTNSSELWANIPEEHRTEQNQVATVLGLKWHTDSDILRLAIDHTNFFRPITSKREMLSIIASIFDPCGFIAPLLLSSRVLLQNLWVKKYKWDTPLDEAELREWERCIKPLQHIKEFEIPRYYHHNKTQNPLRDQSETKIQLHCFTDASQLAYSAVLYIRRTNNGSTSINLVMSRTRLCPVKDRERMTIPKLELLGVTIGARLLAYAKETLHINIDQMYLWTDSQVVLGWMKTEKLLTPFVSRRITEIKSVPLVRFRYTTSNENPADIATREQFNSLPILWRTGPSFLSKPEEFWPPDTYDWQSISATALLEESNQPIHHQNSTSTLATQVLEEQEPDIDGDMENENQPQQGADMPQDNAQDPLLPSQLTTIKQLQLENYPKEAQGQCTHLTRSLSLFKDEQGILRCKGRLQNAILPLDQKFPILLPKATQFTSGLIMKLHEDNKHVGASHTLSLLRKRFWVPHGRSQVNQVLKRCKICIKYGGGPYKLPPMPPLPPERVKLCRPFLYTGLDYLGPLTVINDSASEKRWCCIFTCMASRAIHLEVIKNLSAEEFLLCLRRYVAAHGTPALIVSDNAAQFKLAADVLQSSICTEHNVAWHFIPELSPWQGGFYERLVGIVKHCLRRSLDKILLNDNQLLTVFKEIETILNSRPLTTVGNDLEHVLSPSDFLSNCGTHPLPLPSEANPTNITATRANLIEGWKKGQQALAEFRTIFQDQYLASLRERPLTSHSQPRTLAKQEPKVGAVVQLWDEKQKTTNRAHWKVGKIKALLPSRDGQIRTVQVQLDSGTTLSRSVSHLYPLELSDDDPEEGQLGITTINPPASNDELPGEPPRDGPLLHVLPPETVEAPSSPAQQAIEGAPGPYDSERTPQPSPPNLQDQVRYSQQDVATPDAEATTSRPQRQSSKHARELIRRWTQCLVAHAPIAHPPGQTA